MKLEQTWRWYGPKDPISLQEIKQTGAAGIVTALHHIPNGVAWTKDEINKRKTIIEDAGLRWSVVESIPVHEDIKRQTGRFKEYIENYKESIHNLAECGINTVCYNFMPILDWTRTELEYPMEDGSTALRFDETALAAFDLHILQRKNAENDYSPDVVNKANQFYKHHDEDTLNKLSDTVLKGLPGSEEGYSLDEFRGMLDSYKEITDHVLRQNLYYFLNKIIPEAEEAGVRMAIHPDDPPFPLLGLPRVVSTEPDVLELLNCIRSSSNGLTFCTGSFGARPDNDLPGMAKRLGPCIHFIHLRNVKRETGRSFHEANHLEGSTNMAGVMESLIKEQIRRKNDGRADLNIPMRPDHGHRMLSDFKTKSYPGYSLVGRLRGLAELRGLEEGIRKRL